MARHVDEQDEITFGDTASNLADIIDDLEDLATVLLTPVSHLRNIDEAWSNEVERFLPFIDERHVSDRFPKAPRYLVERLGHANSMRRANLAYLKSFVTLPEHNVVETVAEKVIHEASRTIKSKATSFRDSALGTSIANSSAFIPPVSSHHDSEGNTMGSNQRDRSAQSDNNDDDPASETTSLASCTSYAPTVADEDAITHARVPAPPAEFFSDEPFKCPYCGTILTNIINRKAWK